MLDRASLDNFSTPARRRFVPDRTKPVQERILPRRDVRKMSVGAGSIADIRSTNAFLEQNFKVGLRELQPDIGAVSTGSTPIRTCRRLRCAKFADAQMDTLTNPTSSSRSSRPALGNDRGTKVKLDRRSTLRNCFGTHRILKSSLYRREMMTSGGSSSQKDRTLRRTNQSIPSASGLYRGVPETPE